MEASRHIRPAGDGGTRWGAHESHAGACSPRAVRSRSARGRRRARTTRAEGPHDRLRSDLGEGRPGGRQGGRDLCAEQMLVVTAQANLTGPSSGLVRRRCEASCWTFATRSLRRSC